MKSESGFTLLEVLLAAAVMSLLLAIGTPVYASFQNRNDLDVTTQSVVEALRRASTYARAGKGDANWGVKLQSGSAVLYEGTSYTARDTTSDETIAITSNITPGGLGEVTFTKLTGAPGTTGSITLTSSVVSDVKTITINGEGLVSY